MIATRLKIEIGLADLNDVLVLDDETGERLGYATYRRNDPDIRAAINAIERARQEAGLEILRRHGGNVT